MKNEIPKREKKVISVQTMKRIVIIVIQLTLVYCFSGDFQPFFYQAF